MRDRRLLGWHTHAHRPSPLLHAGCFPLHRTRRTMRQASSKCESVLIRSPYILRMCVAGGSGYTDDKHILHLRLRCTAAAHNDTRSRGASFQEQQPFRSETNMKNTPPSSCMLIFNDNCEPVFVRKVSTRRTKPRTILPM